MLQDTSGSSTILGEVLLLAVVVSSASAVVFYGITVTYHDDQKALFTCNTLNDSIALILSGGIVDLEDVRILVTNKTTGSRVDFIYWSGSLTSTNGNIQPIVHSSSNTLLPGDCILLKGSNPNWKVYVMYSNSHSIDYCTTTER